MEEKGTSCSTIRLALDDDPLAGLQKTANKARGQSIESSIASDPTASAVAADTASAESFPARYVEDLRYRRAQSGPVRFVLHWHKAASRQRRMGSMQGLI